MSNYRLALKANQDRINFLTDDIARQITQIDKEITERERTRQTLLETKAILDDYGRLMALELAGK